MISQRLQPDWLLTPGGWVQHGEIMLEGEHIASIGPASEGGVRLPRRAILPGMVNAHSHAFQRLIRGRTEWRHPERPSDDFWSWRELMYRAALKVSPEQLEVVARLLYLEMLEAGITSVGEFHYLHHQPDGTPYTDPDELARRLAAAAQWAGLELVLLRCNYARAGYQVEANPLQRRFIDRHWSDTLEACERLQRLGIKVGVAPHSVRAVPPDWLAPLADYARLHKLPLHMHVSEQPKELEQCLAENGAHPIEFLSRQGLLDERFTAVHAIHLADPEYALLGSSHVCSCPTTERNLGDGIVAADRLREHGVRLALGSDSQCQVDLLEDARQLDYHLRLERRQRAVLDAPAGGLAHWLWQAATTNGASSLAQPCGVLQPGLRADFIAIDLDHPRLVSDDPRWLLDEIVWGAPSEAVMQTWTGGVARLQDGRHPGREQAVRDYHQVLLELGDG